jgi:hypothetical protein
MESDMNKGTLRQGADYARTLTACQCCRRGRRAENRIAGDSYVAIMFFMRYPLNHIASSYFSPFGAAPMLTSPFLKRITLLPERMLPDLFPFSRLKWLNEDFEISLTSPITILAGENGSGKSTLLEAIARLAGFPAYGGSRDHQLLSGVGSDPLAHALRASWLPKVTRGFFFRAESFFNLADYIDRKSTRLNSSHNPASRMPSSA